MLNTFIKFNQVGYCEAQECEVVTPCLSSDEYIESFLPAKPSDVIKVIVNKSDASSYGAEHLAIYLADDCGTVLDIELEYTIEESTTQYFISVTIPVDLKGIYRIAIVRNLQISISSYTPESTEGACDGIITFEILNAPAQVFEWSIDGVNYQESSTFTDVCLDQIITAYVRVQEDECNSGEAQFDFTTIDCELLNDLYLFDLIDVELSKLRDCYLNDWL
jgi:hypothetical protein